MTHKHPVHRLSPQDRAELQRIRQKAEHFIRHNPPAGPARFLEEEDFELIDFVNLEASF